MIKRPLDLNRYFPFFLGTIANKWTSTSSRTYLKRFGVGITEWRILASLDATGSSSSLDIANLVGMDQAAVSRGIRHLEKNGLVVPLQGRFRGRTKPYELTITGKALCERIRDLALERQEVLIQDLDSRERETLLVLLRKIHRRLNDL